MENEKKVKAGGVGAIFLIVAGVVLLLNNLGFLDWEVWLVLWQFWPVLLILAGIEIILGHSSRSRWLVTILGLVLAAFIIIAFILAPTYPRLERWLERRFPKWPENFRFYPESVDEGLTSRHQFLRKFN